MNFFLLSSFALMAMIIVLTAGLFLISLFNMSSKGDYRKWLIIYFSGLFLWHLVGFISGGVFDDLREVTYRYTNTIFNLGFAITCVGFIQVAYTYPIETFSIERKRILVISLCISTGYVVSIIWFHFIQDQTGLNSFTYGSFVNLLAGVFGLITNIWVVLVFMRKSISLRRKYPQYVRPSMFLAVITILNILIAGLFVFPLISHELVIIIYIIGVWILIQAQVFIFITYSVFPIRFQDKLVAITFASVMTILTITSMLMVDFTDNSNDKANFLQRLKDQEVLTRLAYVILGSTFFVLTALPLVLKVSLVKPLNRLMEGIQRANQGDLSVHVPTGVLDEIGLVIQNFNRMTQSLKKVNNKLTEYADNLELKVDQRTAELKNSLDELKSTQNQLIHSEKMASLGELTAGIAHEIQNPLNFVNNFSDLNKELIDELKEAVAQNDQEEVAAILKDLEENESKITHHGKRAEEIVKSMLQHSRTGSNEKELTDINVLADEYLRLAYHGLRAKDKNGPTTRFNADFKTKLDADLPKVNVVPQDIGRVLLNLINNAFQAVQDVENPLVTVVTQSNPLPGGRSDDSVKDGSIQITVSDNGPGIPDDIKDKIFQPFFTTKAAGKGTGLGLSMSYDIVTKGHNGTIEVESEVGKGTRFIVTLPKNDKLNEDSYSR